MAGDGAAQVQLIQTQLSITKKPDSSTARINCKVDGINFGDAYIHWYRQRPGEAPEWLLYYKTDSDSSNPNRNKFGAYKIPGKDTCTLTVDPTYNDAATYYCATWDLTVLESHRCELSSSSFTSGSPTLESHRYHVPPGMVFCTLATIAWERIQELGLDGHAQKTVTQTPISITKQKGKTAVMLCEIRGATIKSEYIHWYRQSPGKAPKRILYAQATSVTVDEGVDKGRFEVSNAKLIYFKTTSFCQFINKKILALYFCKGCVHSDTSSGVYIKVFGSGTKLIVTNTKAKLNPQKVQILSPTTQDGNGTYVCLFEDFFPNVINVTWEGPDADKNAIRGEIWPSGDDQNSYSMSSWLTIDDPDQMYNCTYKHESGKDSVPLQSQAPNAPDNQIVPCVNRVENGTTLSTDYDFTESLTHTTAYFVYILLLLKSTMYYVIVLFFMYRMKSSSKRHGKKPCNRIERYLIFIDFCKGFTHCVMSSGYYIKVFGSGTKLFVTVYELLFCLKLHIKNMKLSGPDPQWSPYDFQQLKIWPMSFCKAPERSENNYIKVFGSGTELIVTNTKAKLDPEKIQILSPTKQEGKGTHICLIEDFFPKIIKVTWEGLNAEKNAIRGEIWHREDNTESYSVTSWLTVDDPDQTYKCKYDHESRKGVVPLESQAPILPDNQIVPSTTTGCIHKTENVTTPSTDYDITESLTHTTAYFVYILLLLKSTMYYVIVLFFMYRMKSSSKRHGKKP
ncbi:uncharacterized protein LOC102448091 [Pelodiscus sinensis]|uniref:uncharacterized protein LOC102448091 n=1 Tax=Pelodiscus sinensis TaxID=13735 RepID=UPI003F6D35B2